MKTVKQRIVQNVWVCCNIIIPMVAGGLFYLFFCPDISFSRSLRNRFGISYYYDISDNTVMMIIRCWGLDMLWAYSLCVCLMWVIKKRSIALLISSIFAVATESLQFFGMISGTFDPLDIICEITAILAAGYAIGKTVCKIEKSIGNI